VPAAAAVLIDIDGVLTVSWRAVPGTPAALQRLRDAGLGIALITNTTSRSRQSIAAALTNAGFGVGAAEILTAPALTAAYLRQHHAGGRCLVLNSGDVRDDLGGVTIAEPGGPVDVVVVGGAGPEFGYDALNQVFQLALDGVPLVAMHENLYWRTAEGFQLDGGAYLRAIEAAAGVHAVVIGKPAPACFHAAMRDLGVPPDAAVMVGDDLDADVLAAQAAGLTGVLVRTGKFRAETLARAAAEPDYVLDSFADLPTLLGLT
jgi:HAD superfamily hydrolase (TIGR01458 family)